MFIIDKLYRYIYAEGHNSVLTLLVELFYLYNEWEKNDAF